MENRLAAADIAPRVLLTGASQGIGKAILLKLARSQHFVLGLSRTKPEELTSPSQSPESEYLAWRPLDLSHLAEVAECASWLESLVVRALILSAVDYGANQRHLASATSAQEWQKVIATNCIGQCLLTSLLLPKLVAHAPGIIVNVSSEVAVLPGPGRAAYAASKAGLHAMLRAAAAEHPLESLRVYQLVPTFQLLTNGIRRRRPSGFDFSSYVDPAVIAEVVDQLLSPSGNSIAPGTYLVHRDGTITRHPEIEHL